jgi:hypothetical protein
MSTNELAWAPVTPIDVIDSALEPELVRVMARSSLTVPTIVDVKATLLGEKLTTGPAVIVTLTAADVDESKVELPEYTATIELLPTGNELVVKLAWPVALSVTFPKAFEPALNVTVPPGAADPLAGLTNAVSAIGAPCGAVVDETVSVVVVATPTASKVTSSTNADTSAPLSPRPANVNV